MSEAVEEAVLAEDNISDEARQKRYLTPKEMLAYCLVGLTQKNLDEFNNTKMNYFIIQYLKIDPKLFAKIVFGTTVYDAVDDTISGLVIDRTRTRWGRIRPYLIFPIPLWFIGTIMLYTVPKSLTAGLLAVWAAAAIVLKGLGMSYFGAWTLIMYNDTPNIKERNSLITTSEFVKLFGTFFVSFMTIPLDIFQKMGFSTYNIYHYFAWFSCIVTAIACIYGFRNMRERIPLQSREEMNKTSPIESFKQVLKNPPLFVYILANFFNSFKSVGSANETFFWFNCTGKYTYATVAGLFTGLPNYFMTPLSGKWMNKYGAKKVITTACLFGGAAYMTMYFVGYHPFSAQFADKPVANLAWLIIALTICGLPNCVIRVCMPSLNGDIFDYSEWKTGMRNEGLVNTVSGYFGKLGNSLNGWLSNMVLAWIGYSSINDSFGNPIPNTDPKVQKGLWIIFAIAPAAARFLTGIAFLFFRIDGEAKQRMLDELGTRRAAAVKSAQEAEAELTE